MSKLELHNLDLESVYRLIKDNIYSCVVLDKKVDDEKYHHESDYTRLLNILKYGLLSYELYAKKVENRKLTEKEIYILSDDCHANGMNYISLSSMDIDFSKMYEYELNYNSYKGLGPDIIVSSSVSVHRNSINYFNEFLVEDNIPVDMFNCVDFKLLRIPFYSFYCKEKDNDEFKKNLLIQHYNCLLQVAQYIDQNNLNIEIRETSEVTNNDEKTKALVLDRKKLIKLEEIK